MTYDLRRLRLAGLIRRIGHTNAYALTPDGIRFAVFYTKLSNRLLRPLMAADERQQHLEMVPATHATGYIDADLRDTPAILDRATRLLDFSKPVAVTLVSILHALPDADDPYAIVARLLEAVPSGSYLAISHAASDILDRERQDSFEDVLRGKMQQQLTLRSRERVGRFFADRAWQRLAWCSWRNGGRSRASPGRAGRPCCARWAASREVTAALEPCLNGLRLPRRPVSLQLA